MEKKISKVNTKKQMPFDLHFSKGEKEKEYNALLDPHANYFFVSQGAKERLKDLKLQLRKQKKSKSPQKQQMIQLINEKIRFQFPRINPPWLRDSNRQKQQSLNDKKMSQKLLWNPLTERGRRSSNKSNLNKIKAKAQQQSELPIPELKISQQSGLQKQGRKKKGLKMQKHAKKVNHQDFMSFLTKKKEQVISDSAPEGREC